MKSLALAAMRSLFNRFSLTIVLAHLFSATLSADTLALNPVKDNTLYGNTGSGFQEHTCGAGPGLFAGRSGGGQFRRALLKFDIAGNVPAGSVINSVTLTLQMNRTADSQSLAISLHPLTRDWGEGAVDCSISGLHGGGGGGGAPAAAGDATWLSAAHQQVLWTSPGGDFGAASGSTLVSNVNGSLAVWDSASAGNSGMVTDIQNWLDTASGNHGWIMVSDETRTSASARRFDSRESSPQPVLNIDFTPPAPVYACCAANGDCSLSDAATCTSGGGTPDTGTSSCSPNPCPQPIGACCNTDNTCGESVARDVCQAGGGQFQGGGSTCAIADCGLEPFVDALPVPAVATPVGTRADGALQYNVTMNEIQQQLHRDLPPTTLWGYNNSYPGPTIEATVDQTVEIKYSNDLPDAPHHLAVDTCSHGPNYWDNSARTVPHLHGGHVPARFDGQPEYDFKPGEFDVYEYPNKQLPATLWYHDHALGITRLNVYMGLAGMYLVRDSIEAALALPSGEFEVPLVIQDRQINPDGSLFYPATLQNAFFGDTTLVNGKVWPYLNVKQGKYRFRILNGSQARVYSLRLENQADTGQVIPFTLIGTDGGLIDAPQPLGSIEAAPAERFDVVIDFASFAPGTEIILRNDDATTPLLPGVMKFVVTGVPGDTAPLPATLRPVATIAESEAAGTRRFLLKKVNHPCSGNEWLVQSLDSNDNVIGQHWDDITEYPILGDTEIWEFENPSNMMHPMHVHLVMFQVLDKTDLNTGLPIPLEPWELNTWKDTVQVPSGSKVRVIMRFEDYLGRFAYHCHILDHEDQEMMRQFQTSNDPANCNNNGICDISEDCISCPADCGQVTGASCGNGLCEMGDGENCITCPGDCAGDQGAASPWCCGADSGGALGSIGCGDDGNGNSCIDASQSRYCREMPRVQACCGDALCEGGESAGSCGVDCLDTDGDGFTDITDSDDDNDGLPDTIEALGGSNSLLADSDGDGLVDGADGAVPVGALANGVDADGDGYIDGEQDFGTSPVNTDSDGDRLDDGLEVANGANPDDPGSWPNLADGNVAPLGAPDAELNSGDLLLAWRIMLGKVTATALELAHGDMDADGDIDLPDVLEIQQLLLTPAP